MKRSAFKAAVTTETRGLLPPVGTRRFYGRGTSKSDPVRSRAFELIYDRESLVSTGSPPHPDSRTCVAVDLTPWLPDGEAGGAGVLALDLVERLLRLAPSWQLLLLTSSWNHEALGVRFPGLPRMQVHSPHPTGTAAASLLLQRLSSAFGPHLTSRLARSVGVTAWRGVRWLAVRLPRRSGSGLREHGVHLLFCPFTAPRYAEPGVRTVVLLHDLQHRDYPQFFDQRELIARDTHLEWLRRWADVVICVSEFSRQSLLRHVDFPVERTRVVPTAIHERLGRVAVKEGNRLRTQLGLSREYLFYPGNAWPHKNHRLLVAAFALLLKRAPDLDLDLVFTGALPHPDLDLAIRRMGLEKRVHCVGYCTAHQLAALYEGSRMVVFPSLYEGFGIPVLEAMWFGKPVVCSDRTSLPEVAGDAAHYFDARRPEDMVRAMADVLRDDALAAGLVERGRLRLRHFNADNMALAYLDVFRDTLQREAPFRDSVSGVFEDGWAGGTVRLAHSGGTRRVVLELDAPEWLPHQIVEIRVVANGRHVSDRWRLRRGERQTFEVSLPDAPGILALDFAPVFQPRAHGFGEDVRQLACLCRSISIAQGDQPGPNLIPARLGA